MLSSLSQLIRRLFPRPNIILAAGMPRSGSTWLYNAARLLLQSSVNDADELTCGWIGDWEKLPTTNTVLLKIHDFELSVVARSRKILYSYRDVRDALASSVRKFGTTPTLDLARAWLAHDQRWRPVADFVMRYETMIQSPSRVVEQIADVLRIPVRPNDIVEQVESLDSNSQASYDPATLLHPHHITDGRHGTWTDWLSKDLVQQIELEFQEWFEVNGYPLTALG